MMVRLGGRAWDEAVAADDEARDVLARLARTPPPAPPPAPGDRHDDILSRGNYGRGLARRLGSDHRAVPGTMRLFYRAAYLWAGRD
jgi:hypothetical protein